MKAYLQENPATRLVLMDDGLQHLSLVSVHPRGGCMGGGVSGGDEGRDACGGRPPLRPASLV